MPIGVSGTGYGIGFMVATALLHGFGITLGLAIGRFDEAPDAIAMQTCGVAIALIGAGLTRQPGVSKGRGRELARNEAVIFPLLAE